MCRQLLRICPPGQRPDYISTNGTTYVVCVEDTSGENIGLILGLSLGISLGIIVLIMLGLLYSKWKEEQKCYPFLLMSTPAAAPPPLRRWETFIHDGSYIRRIAQLLEFEEKIPKDIEDYFVEHYPKLWVEVTQEGHDFVLRSAKLIKVLFEEQAKIEKRSVTETIEAWEHKLVDKSGGEWAFKIMEEVKGAPLT